MKSELLAASIGAFVLQLASSAYAKETVAIESFCFDDSLSGATVQCTEGGRIWATLRNTPTPEIDWNDPNSWPTDVTNYTTSHSIGQADQRRCVDLVRRDPMYSSVSDADIFVSCAARVDWIAPWGIASGEDQWFGIGAPIERGESRNANGEIEMQGVIAKADALSCGCYARVDGPE